MVPILWHSNAPWANSGYGNQTKLFTPRIKDIGYDVAISAFYGAAGAHFSHAGINVMPRATDAYGSDILTPHALKHFGELKDGLVVTLMDVFVLNPSIFDKTNGACWVPIDHEPVPPMVRDFFRKAEHVTPIAMSQFGQRELQKALPGRVVEYVPHGIETDVFKPLSADDRLAARESFGVDEDTFVVGVVAANQANPSRKSYGEIIQAFARFARQREKTLLYLHTCKDDRFGGVDLLPLLEACGLSPDQVKIVPQYDYITGLLGDDYMMRAYNVMDVLLNPAMGEGFGIPIIEAQACGVPVIVSDFSAMPEVGKVGWHVGGQMTWTGQKSWQIVPSVDQIVASLCQAYDGMAARKRGAAREHALAYDADLVTREYWTPVLDRIVSTMRTTSDYLVTSDSVFVP